MRRSVGIAAGIIGAATIAVFAASCNDSTGTTTPTYTATMVGANERPNPITSSGSGVATFVDIGSEIDWTIELTNMTGVFASHIHGPATVDQSTAIIFNLFLPIGSSATLNGVVARGVINNASNAAVSLDSLRTLFNNGMAYVNVHTTAHTAGEIRGQIARTP